jgi:SAM-dependent methyltransferase
MVERIDIRETRESYDRVAQNYLELVRDTIDHLPFERSMLRTFADLVSASASASASASGTGTGTGTDVLDIGCGPGHVSERLRVLGLNPTGIDLSPGMIDVARRTYPAVPFRVGSMEQLDEPAASASGILAHYSLIHIPPAERAAVIRNFARTLRPGGILLLAFQVGDEARRIEHGYGHDVGMTAYRLRPEQLVELGEEAGLRHLATMVTRPASNQKSDQAFVYLERPAATGDEAA